MAARTNRKERRRDSWFSQQLWRMGRYTSWRVLIVSVILLLVGVAMVFTASSYRALLEASGNSAYYAIRQLIYVVIGVLAMLFVSALKPAFLQKKHIMGVMVVGLTVALLVARFLTPRVNGAHGWINLGLFSIQPVEFLKPVLVLLWAYFLTHYQRAIYQRGFWHTMRQRWHIPLALALFFLLTLIMPDFGGLFLLLAIWTMMALASGVAAKNTWRLLAVGLLGYIALVVFVQVADVSWLNQLHYGIRRLTAFVNPFADESGSGLQLANSYYALARGGFFGTGVGNSIEKRGLLPEAHNDFIIAIVGEEFGFFGILLILILYFFLIIYLFRQAQTMHYRYDKLVTVGVASYLLVQAVVNLGAVNGLLPITGVTFPFISYGGSSIIVTAIMIGLALAMIRHERIEQERRKVVRRHAHGTTL